MCQHKEEALDPLTRPGCSAPPPLCAPVACCRERLPPNSIPSVPSRPTSVASTASNAPPWEFNKQSRHLGPPTTNSPTTTCASRLSITKGKRSKLLLLLCFPGLVSSTDHMLLSQAASAPSRSQLLCDPPSHASYIQCSQIHPHAAHLLNTHPPYRASHSREPHAAHRLSQLSDHIHHMWNHSQDPRS